MVHDHSDARGDVRLPEKPTAGTVAGPVTAQQYADKNWNKRQAGHHRSAPSQGDSRTGYRTQPDAAALQPDTSGIMLWCNPTWTDALGYLTGDLVGQHLSTLVHPDDVLACQNALQALTTRTSTTQ